MDHAAVDASGMPPEYLHELANGTFVHFGMFSIFGPGANCTLDLCPVDWTVYKYRPSLPVNAVFVGLYVATFAVHLYLGLRWRTWSFLAFMGAGCGFGAVGYAGRIILWVNPWSFAGFMIQMVFITSGPVFFTAAIYVTLSRAIRFFAPEISRLPPRILYWIFIGADILCLVLQAAGGVLSTMSSSGSQTGAFVSISGLVLQVVVLVAFCVFFVDYIVRYIKLQRARHGTTKVTIGTRQKMFFGSLALAIVLILARCAYRVEELSEGYIDSDRLTNEAMFIGLEGVLMVCAIVALFIGHPGFGFKEDSAKGEGFDFLAPKAKKGEDGRDVFSSRATFILCAMGGAVGLGNLLRFPSIVYNNYGAQFFIPYLIALFFIALPVLILEIAIGTAYRSGCVVAWSHDTATFFIEEVTRQVSSVGGELNEDGTVVSYMSYLGTALVGETVGWAAFVWFVTWLCTFRGVGLTGRVIYITMALPLIMIIILVGYSASLPNTGDGTKLYFVIAIASFLISLIYCTEFGLQILDAVDTYVNGIALFFVVWCEAFAATTFYRYKDAVSQVGWVAYIVFNLGLVLAQVLGIVVVYTSRVEIGAGVGFGIFIIAVIACGVLAKTPQVPAPGFWGRGILNKIWWCALYPAYQLTADLNVVIGVGKNWNIPIVWAPCLKFISGPILLIVLSFAYDGFSAKIADPIFIYGFSMMHLVYPIVVAGLVFPSWFNFLIAHDKLEKGDYPVAPMEIYDQSLHPSQPPAYHADVEEGALQAEEESKAAYSKTQ